MIPKRYRFGAIFLVILIILALYRIDQRHIPGPIVQLQAKQAQLQAEIEAQQEELKRLNGLVQSAWYKAEAANSWIAMEQQMQEVPNYEKDNREGN